MNINKLIDEWSSMEKGESICDISKDSVTEKIYRYLPVPNDFEIKWAEMSSFGGYPSGIVLTDKGLFVKAAREAAKEQAEKEQKKKPEVIYQYIPWDYFDPESLGITEEIRNGVKTYTVVFDGKKVTECYDRGLYSLFQKIRNTARTEREKEILQSAFFSAEMNVSAVEAAAFHAANGMENNGTGHGVYAEKATVIMDRFSGEQVSHTGGDNAKNGPDKIVNGVRVQCKYHKTAGSSVSDCFEKDIQTGRKTYRYIGSDGKPMMLEVPKDQYEKAVEAMRKRIMNGEVPGVTDPDEAANIVRKGKLTYAQVRNLAKAGTIESLTYDAVTGAVTCTAVCGVSALTAFAIVFWRTKDRKKAASAALETGLAVFGPCFLGFILVSQIARTSLPTMLIPSTTAFAKWLDPKTVQKIVNAFRALAGKKPISGAAAQNSFAKALRSTVLTQAVMFCVMAVPDTVRVIDRKISGSQYTKNLLTSAGSLAGGAGASYAAGRLFGKLLSGKPVIAKVAGTCIAVVGGFVSGAVVKSILNLFREDDAVIYTRMFNAVVTAMCLEYVLSEEELGELVKELDNDSKNMEKLMKEIHKSKHQYYDIEQFLKPHFENVVSARSVIRMKDQAEMITSINDTIVKTTEGVAD